MAVKRPIVHAGGRLKELPAGDTLAGVRVALGAGGAVDGEFNPAMSGPGTTIASRTVTIASGGSTISCALPAKRAGLRYFEVTFHGSSSSNCAVGVVGAITDFEHQIGYDGASDEIGMFQNSGNIYNGTSSAGSAASFDTDGDVVGVAVNDSRQVWFRVNGSNWNGSGANNPVTGVGGITIAGSDDLFPAVGSDEDCEFIFNPGATLAGALPWGYFDTSDATRVEDVELDDPQEGDVLMFDGAKWVNAPSGGGGSMIYRKQATFTSSGTFTLPSTALPSVDYDLCGGGGAGGASTGASTAAASGGGGGARKKGTITLVPGDSYSVVIGSGGLGANPNGTTASGGNGGASSFAGITADGGKGGKAGINSRVDGGFSGDGTAPARAVRISTVAGYSIVTPVVCMSAPGGGIEFANNTFALPGGIGFDSKCSGGGAAAGDGSLFGGPGAGNGYYGTTPSGCNATTPGSGGGGMVRPSNSSSHYGGNGFRGQLDIIYWDTVP